MKAFKTFSSGLLMLVILATLCSASAGVLSFSTGMPLKTTPAAPKTVTGRVIESSTGLPLPAALVKIKGTDTSTSTDVDGKYSIVTKEGDKLLFSYIGFRTQERKVGKQNVINVKLEEESNSLEEVVVVGYETYDRKGRKDKDVSRALQGQIGGLNIVANTGAPGAANAIRIRGVASGKMYDQVGGYIAPGTGIPTQPNDEEYGKWVENAFTSPKSEPLSTFSIDVDNASYTNIRRFLNNGQKVPTDAVRVEEMLNFFKYDYTEPTGEHPFSINTEYSDCPWNPGSKLLRIGLQGKNIPTDKLPASNLVFLIDVSGSMNSENKLPLLRESLKVLTAQLRDEDKVSIVVYAGAAGMVLAPTSGSDKQKIVSALDQLTAGGSTAGGAGIELAYKTAQENFIKGGNNRVILATDGDFNVGASSDSDMETLIEQKRKSGVFLTVLGYGMGNYKDSKMEILADKGNGNYAYIDNMQEANRFLGREFKGSMFAIAKDVKIQIEFNPEFVQSYRLIGYENRKLRPEDFTNDVIDAGELGSGHTVTALYEIVPPGVNNPYASALNNLKYTDTKVKNGAFPLELATVKFRYKKPDGDKSTEISQTVPIQAIALENASADMKFATSVAWFGLRLRESKLIQDSSLSKIEKLAREGLGKDPEGYKAELLRLMKTPVLVAGN